MCVVVVVLRFCSPLGPAVRQHYGTICSSILANHRRKKQLWRCSFSCLGPAAPPPPRRVAVRTAPAAMMRFCIGSAHPRR